MTDARLAVEHDESGTLPIEWMMKPRPVSRPSDRRERIIESIKKRITVNQNNCWVWGGPHSGNGRGGGYPRMSLEGHTVAVHRVMYVCHHGYVSSRKHLDHTCKNRMCVNPEHLEVTTYKENCKRRDKNGKDISGIVVEEQ